MTPIRKGTATPAPHPREFNEFIGPCAEEGYIDPQGRTWVHVPWVGWRLAPPSPFFVQPQRAARRQRWSKLKHALGL